MPVDLGHLTERQEQRMKKWMDEEYEGEKGRERKVELIVKERPISSVKLNKTTGGGFLKKLPPW